MKRVPTKQITCTRDQYRVIGSIGKSGLARFKIRFADAHGGPVNIDMAEEDAENLIKAFQSVAYRLAVHRSSGEQTELELAAPEKNAYTEQS